MKKPIARALRILILIMLLTGTILLHRSGFLQTTLEWIKDFGPWGPLVFFALCVASVVFLIPSFVFTVAGGMLFGFWKGLFLSATGMSLGAGIAMWLGRTAARDLIRRKFRHYPQFQKLTRIAQTRGWKIIALARLTPIFPFAIGNYFFGLTEIGWPAYVFASWLGTLPSAAVYTYVGTLTNSLASNSNRARTPAEWVLLIFGILASIVLSLYLKRLAEKDLASINKNESSSNVI